MNRILIAEDEQAIANMMKLCLSKNGYLCEVANDGTSALQKIEEKRKRKDYYHRFPFRRGYRRFVRYRS